MENIRGFLMAVPIPITQEDMIDEERLRAGVEELVIKEVLGILAFGNHGEFYTVGEKQMEQGLVIILDQVGGRVPVYLGIGAINSSRCCRLAQMGQRYLVSGISILPPMFLTPTQEELLEHVKIIANSVPELPVIIYNNPGIVGYLVTAELVARLSAEVDNFIGVNDTFGNLLLPALFIDQIRQSGVHVLGGSKPFQLLQEPDQRKTRWENRTILELIVDINDRYVKGDLQQILEVYCQRRHQCRV